MIDPDTGLPLSRGVGATWTVGVRRRDGRDRRGALRHRGDHRRHAAAGRAGEVRRARSPTGSSTSASPSSTPRPRPRGWRSAGCTRSFAVYATFLNRAFDQVLMDVALHKCGVTFVAGPRRCDRQRRRRATTACGTWRCCRSCPGCGIAAPRDGATSCARSCARPSRSRTRRPWCGSPRARSAPTSPPWRPVGRRRRAAPQAERRATCCWSRSARWPRSAWRSPSAARRQGIGVTVVDPRWVKPVAAGPRRPRRAPPVPS